MPVVLYRLFYKVLVQRDAPIKILTQAFIRHDAGLNQIEARVLDALTKVPNLGPLINACIPILL